MSGKRNYAAFVVIAWGILFAVPSFVWASGSTLGAQSTVAPELVKLARERVPWFIAVLWLTGFLKLFASAVGYALSRPRPERIGRYAVFCGGGAATLLTGHGLLFVVRGALAEAGIAPVKSVSIELVRWYLCLWGPYFVVGGVAFAVATRWYLRRVGDAGPRWAVVGAAGGLAVVLVSALSGVG